MTRPVSELKHALALGAQGYSTTLVARRLGIPRSTVRDWLAGRTPVGRSSPGPGCPKCGHASHRFEELPRAYVYLLGIYLGDGCISTHPRGVFRLRITLDSAYPKIVDEAARSMAEVIPASKVGRLLRPSHDIEVSSFSKAWPCLLPQHGPGKKHLRRIELAEWQHRLVERDPKLLLRGLIHSDGCRFMNTGTGWAYPRYSFTNFSADIKRIFTDACDLLRLRWTTAGDRTIYVSRKADVDRMDRFIGPKA